MARKFIDISVTLEASIASDPPFMLPNIDYFSHEETGSDLTSFFPDLTIEQLPNGEGWEVEQLKVSTRNGAHLDAPYHHHSTMNRQFTEGGEPAIKIYEVPLEWCLNPGIKLDFRHSEDGYVATPGDIVNELVRIGHELQPLDIVVINTSAGTCYGQDDYLTK